MTTQIKTEDGVINAHHWKEIPFTTTAEQIINGFVQCPELEEYYYRKFVSDAKEAEFLSFTSH